MAVVNTKKYLAYYIYEKKIDSINGNYLKLDVGATEDFGVSNGVNNNNAIARANALQNQLGNDFVVKALRYQNEQPDLIRRPCEFI